MHPPFCNSANGPWVVVVVQEICLTEGFKKMGLIYGFTIPDVGVDVAAGITTLGTELGVIVAAALGLYAAFLLIKLGAKSFGRFASKGA